MRLAADSDRERVAASLREHFVKGRLTLEELSERTELALRARSDGDLRRALDSLPQLTARSVTSVVARGAALVMFTGAWLLFSFVLLAVFALTLLIHGVGAVALVGFLVVWLVPTYLLSRMWRRGLSPRTRDT
jgi:Flp pilus assembly protein TadB